MDEVEIFKICLEYWSSLASELYRENPFSDASPPLIFSQMRNQNQEQEMPPRRILYNPVLSKVSVTDFHINFDNPA